MLLFRSCCCLLFIKVLLSVKTKGRSRLLQSADSHLVLPSPWRMGLIGTCINVLPSKLKLVELLLF